MNLEISYLDVLKWTFRLICTSLARIIETQSIFRFVAMGRRNNSTANAATAVANLPTEPANMSTSHSQHVETSVPLEERLQRLDLADEQIVLIAEEAKNFIQNLNQNDSPNSSVVSDCNDRLNRFSNAVKTFQQIVSTELTYLQKVSSNHPHEGSVYINTLKIDHLKEGIDLKIQRLAEFNN